MRRMNGMSFSARDVIQAVPINSRSAINPAMAVSPKTAQKRDRRAGQSQMSSSSAGLFHPGSIGRVSEAETCSEQTGREKRILLSSPYAIALDRRHDRLDRPRVND